MILTHHRTLKDQTQAARERVEREAEFDRQLCDLLENSSDLIYLHDLDGNYTSISPAGLRLLGYTREEAARLNTSQVLAPEFAHIGREMLERKLHGDGSRPYQVVSME